MVELTTLANGLRIVTDEILGFESAALGVWVNVGSRHETLEEHGLSHLLEHMAFKGTHRRTARGIAEEIENVGGVMNAYTGRDQTAYYARVLKHDVPLVMDILADILQNSIFDEEELKREKSVILQEIGEAEDTPDDIIFDYLQDICYPTQALGRPILGTRENVQAIEKSLIQNYLQKYYCPSRIVIAASGAITHKQILDLVEEHFTRLAPSTTHVFEPAVWSGGTSFRFRDLEQVHLAFALPGVTHSDPDFYTCEVFSTLFGGGMSSRLFQEIREKLGLAYTISSFSSSLADTGMFGVYAGTSADDAPLLMQVIADEFEKVAHNANSDETERAKAQLRSGLIMGMESPMNRCEMMARHLFVHGHVLSPAQLLEHVNKVDAMAIRNFAARLIVSAKPTLCTLGTLKTLDGYEGVLARFLPH